MNLSSILRDIKNTKKPVHLKELRNLHQEMADYITSKKDKVSPSLFLDPALHEWHDAIMKMALSRAEEDTLQKEIGERPEKWCWVLFGSGARSEQTIWTDQDNGLLYESHPDKQRPTQRFIQAFSELGTDYLNKIGYPFCPGHVMATNKRWANETDSWLDAMATHIRIGQPDDIKYLFIAFDLRGLYGDHEMVNVAKEQFVQTIRASSFILERMHDHIREPKVALGFLGHLLTERFGEQSGKLNIKIGYYVPLVNTLKYLAIKHGCLSSSSMERLDYLKSCEVLSESEAFILKQALELCLYFRGLASLNSNEKERDFIDCQTLSETDLERLKVSLKEIKNFQNQVIKKGGSV